MVLRGADEVGIDVDGVHEVFAEACAEQRGVVAGAGADLEDAVAVLDGQVLEHSGHEAGQGAGRGGDAGPCGAVYLFGGVRIEGGHERLIAVDGGQVVGCGHAVVLAPYGDAPVVRLLPEPAGHEQMPGHT